MSKTFIIAEAACTWLHAGLEGAYRSIRAAKECGADAWKTQWTSNAHYMAKARWTRMQLESRYQTVDQMAEKYQRLAYFGTYLLRMKEECERVGLEFMVTVFLPEDVEFISDLVKRFKVSAFESKDKAFVDPILELSMVYSKELVISGNPGSLKWYGPTVKFLHCVSEYPCPPENLMLSYLGEFSTDSAGFAQRTYAGLSDHTTSTLTGAVAVGAGARIIEKHVRLSDTPSSDPDYGHSLLLEREIPFTHSPFMQYVDNIREAERML